MFHEALNKSDGKFTSVISDNQCAFFFIIPGDWDGKNDPLQQLSPRQIYYSRYPM